MVRIEEHKHLTENKIIENLPLPSKVYLYLSQHIGKPNEPIVKKGDSVLVMDGSVNFQPTEQALYKLAWWHSGSGFYGNMILPHPAMSSFPNDGYGDLQMYNLLEERSVVLLDQLPGKIDPIVWNIDYPY